MTPADREKLVEAFERAVRLDESGFESMRSRLPLTRAALLAAMEPVGEEYEVAAMSDGCVSMPVVLLTGPQFDMGDRVRVSKVEAA